MSSWVTSRHSLGPICCPMSALSSSMPFTVVGVLMRRSISAAVVPGLRLESLAKGLPAVLRDRLAMRGQDCVEVELEERLERRVEAVAIEALDLRVDLVRGPHSDAALPLDHGVAEDKGPVAREVEGHLIAARLADRMGGDAGGQRDAGLDFPEAGCVLEPLGARAVPVDGGLGAISVPPPQLLRAAHVVRD